MLLHCLLHLVLPHYHVSSLSNLALVSSPSLPAPPDLALVPGAGPGASPCPVSAGVKRARPSGVGAAGGNGIGGNTTGGGMTGGGVIGGGGMAPPSVERWNPRTHKGIPPPLGMLPKLVQLPYAVIFYRILTYPLIIYVS